MPTTEPTSVSSPPTRGPELRPPDRGKAEAPKGDFARTLGEKRRVEPDDDEPQTPLDPRQPPAAASEPTPSQPPVEQGQTGSAATSEPAQPSSSEAQIVPPGAATAGAGEGGPNRFVEILPQPLSREPAGTASPQPGGDAANQPGLPAAAPPAPVASVPTVPQDGAAADHPDQQPAATPRGTAAPPPGGAAAQQQSPPPNTTGVPTSETATTPPAGASGDGNTAGAGQDQLESRGGEPQGSHLHHPALGRAADVQTAVQVENMTGAAPAPSLSGAAHPSTAALAPGGGEPPLPAPPDTQAEQSVPRVLRGLHAMVNQRGGVMNMRLEPAQLGQLRVQMSMVRGVVSAQFQAATPEAHALLERSLSSLRAALESHGLTVERLTVSGPQSSGSTGSNGLRDHASHEQAAQQRDHADAGEGRSRGRRDDEDQHRTRPRHRFASTFADELGAPRPGAEAA